MIFITTGTTNFPFRRMDNLVKKLYKIFQKENIIYQSLNSNHTSNKNLVVKKEIDFDLFINIIKKARIIITHGGPATIYNVLKYSNYMPFVIPRLKIYGEHVDDHQVYFVNFLSGKKIIISNKGSGNLVSSVVGYCNNLQRIQSPAHTASKDKLIENLYKYVQQM